MKGELIRTVTADGLELTGFLIDKKSEMVVFHSHGTAGDFYTHKFIETEGEKLSKENISFLTANNRGHDVYAEIRKHNKGKAEWIQIGGGFERFEDCLFDIKAWLDFLQKRGIKKVILQGHSLSQKNLYYQSIKKDKRVVGQIHLSPQNDDGLMFFYLGKEKYNSTNQEIKKMVEQGKGNIVLPQELSPVSYVTSAQMYHGYLTDYGVGTLTPYHNPNSPNWKVISDVRQPLLVVFGSKDAYMKPSPEIAAKIVREKTKKNKKALVKTISGANHSYMDFENELVDLIFNWLKANFL